MCSAPSSRDSSPGREEEDTAVTVEVPPREGEVDTQDTQRMGPLSGSSCCCSARPKPNISKERPSLLKRFHTTIPEKRRKVHVLLLN